MTDYAMGLTRLERLGLAHLEDDPEAMGKELDRRVAAAKQRTEEREKRQAADPVLQAQWAEHRRIRDEREAKEKADQSLAAAPLDSHLLNQEAPENQKS